MATREAVERRRLVRPARNRLRHKPKVLDHTEDEAREAWEAEVIVRLLRRIPFLSRHTLHSAYAYWQARRCGWDVFRPWWRRTGQANPDGTSRLYPPEGCPVWLWWESLDWRERDEITAERRKRGSVQAMTVGLHNPLFDLQTKDGY